MDTTVGALVVDLVLLEKLQRLHAQRLIEERVARVDIVVVGLYLSTQHEFEHIGEQVHLRSLRLYRVVKSGIGVLREINLSVYIASPHYVLLHLRLSGEGDLGAGRELVFIGLAFLLRSLLGATLCRLGTHALHGKQSQDDY